MNNNELKLPDDLFKQGLEDYEAPYADGAWEDMRKLLDKSERKSPFLFWFRRNKKTTITLITITMITTAIISVFSILNTGDKLVPKTADKQENVAHKFGSQKNANTNESNFTTKAEISVGKEEVNNTMPFHSSASAAGETTPKWIAETSGAEMQDKTTGAEKTAIVAAEISDLTAADNLENVTANGEEKTAPVSQEKTEATTPDDNKNEVAQNTSLTKPLDKKDIVVNNSLTKAKDPGAPKLPLPYTTFRGPWMGIHFTMQNPEKPIAMDSGRQHAGFNFQFMSSNRLPSTSFGAYLGFDFGMQFYGRGRNYGVALSNATADSGFTRLNMHSFDLFVRGHFEYADFRLKPYVNVFAGPRIYSTNQYTEAYHHSTNYENSSSNSVHVAASMMFGGALGVRLAVSKHVSLDARMEYMRGTDTRIVDLDQTTFDGGLAAYSLKKIDLKPAYYQFKFGVLFDLWDEYEYEKEHNPTPTNNTEITQQTEYYYFDSTTNQYMKVNCSCKERPMVSSDTTIHRSGVDIDKYPNGNLTPEEQERQRSSGRSGVTVPSGGSSRGSFPGIKSGGGGGIKIKN